MKMSKIAAGIGAVVTLGYGAAAFAIPSPGAVADAWLQVSNFTILAGNNAAGKSFAPLPIGAGVNLNAVTTSADVTATLNNAGGTTSTSVGLGVPFAISRSQGAAGFVPNTLLTGDPTANYAGASTSSVGNALNPLDPASWPILDSDITTYPYADPNDPNRAVGIEANNINVGGLITIVGGSVTAAIINQLDPLGYTTPETLAELRAAGAQLVARRPCVTQWPTA